MRKRTVGLTALAATAALTLSACGSATVGDDAAGDGDTITIGIKFDQPGMGLKDGNTYQGFDVNVATYVAGKLGYDPDHITFVESVSAQREQLLQTGAVDMIVATYSITDARKEVIDFAGPYFVAGQDLLVKADTTDITGPESLEGKNLCSVTGSTSAEKIKENYATGVNLLERPSYSECVTALVAGQVDAVTTDDIILAGFAASQPAGTLKVVGHPFTQEQYGIGLPKGSAERCGEINSAITEMISDGSWEKFIAANVGDDFTPNADLNPPTPAPCA